MATYVTTVAQYLEGQFRPAGYEFESNGFRQGSIQRMLSQGLIDLAADFQPLGDYVVSTDITNIVVVDFGQIPAEPDPNTLYFEREEV